MIRSILAALAVFILAGAASAVTPALGTPVCADGGTCLADGADRVLLERTNSSAIGCGVFVTPSGTSDDTGNEVAALLNLTCVDVIIIDLDGGSGDEITDASDCTTDIDAAGDHAIVQVQ